MDSTTENTVWAKQLLFTNKIILTQVKHMMQNRINSTFKLGYQLKEFTVVPALLSKSSLNGNIGYIITICLKWHSEYKLRSRRTFRAIKSLSFDDLLISLKLMYPLW